MSRSRRLGGLAAACAFALGSLQGAPAVAKTGVASAAPAAASAAVPGDAARGETLYPRCLACHALAHDRVGPRHCGLLGRRAGSVPGFDYSPAMKRSGLTWDVATLDRFLTAPTRVVPETSMTYAGIPDARDRRDLIAYLASVGSSDACARLSGRR